MKINIQGNLIETKADSQLHVVLSGARGPAGPMGSGEAYSQTLSAGTSFQITFATIGFTPSMATLYTSSGAEVSVPITISDKVYIQSNVNLLNHVLKIN